MKKIFSIFAAAFILFGAVSCKNKKDEPSAPKTTFTIDISNITYDGCDFIITPSDNTVEYMRMFMPTEQLENNTPVEIVESKFSDLEVVYTDLKNHGQIHQGRYGDTYTDLIEDTEYVLAVFRIDENLNIVGDVALSKSFYTLPSGYADLGLPSGILWKSYEVDDENKFPLLMTYTEAQDKGTVPTREQWDELLKYCALTWQESAKYGPYLVLTGPNENHISLYNTGKYGTDGKLADNGAYRGYYWTATQSGSVMIQNDVFYYYWDTKETGFGKKPYASQNVCGAILVTDNPNIVPPVR